MSLKRSSYDWLKRFAEGIYFRVFGEEMTAGMRGFVKDLSITSFSMMIVAFLMLIFQLVSGRVLGPEEFGKYSLLDSAGQFVFVIMTLGISTSLIFHVSRERDAKAKKEIGSTAFFVLFVSILFWTIVLILASPLMSRLFGFSSLWFKTLVFYGAVFSLQYFSKSLLRANRQMKMYASIDIISSLVLLVSLFIIIFFFEIQSFITPAISRIVSYFLFFVIVLWLNKGLLLNFSTKYIRPLLAYGAASFLFWVSVAILGVLDKIILTQTLGFETLGIYYAYLLGSNAIIYQMVFVFITNFFPAVSVHNNKRDVYKKLTLLFGGYWWLIFIVSAISTIFMMLLFGREYPVNLFYIVLVSANCVFYTAYQILLWQLNSFGQRQVIKSAQVVFLTVIFQGFSFWLLSSKLGLLGAMIAILATSIIAVLLVNNKVKKAISDE